ncbi:MAG TPA: cold shock and DUF1294 domain-containing protein [Steroidobacteraceae bacterium]|nr:cold shock and DUF1294 domain-containing protein [Steroidobacteraceae bacterium]
MQNASRGKLTSWKTDRAFGFIRPDEGGADVFVHLRDFGQIPRAPRIGDTIRYQRVSDGKGRYRAADVQVEGLQRAAGTAPSRGRSRRQNGGSRTEGAARGAAWLAGLFLAGAVLLAVAGPLPWIVPPLYVIASLAAWLLYVFDKSAAMNGRWRTQEATLLGVGLAGGWPGALVAQQQLRHKNRKLSFQVPFWFTVALNCGALAWACTPSGAQAIRSLVY